MPAYVMLLRAVNVAGRNKLPMRGLPRMFIEAGCEAAQTHIQSGNVVFRAGASLAERLPELVLGGLKEQAGLSVSAMVRSVEELRDIVSGNPFLGTAADTGKLHVVFLSQLPDGGRVAGLDPGRSPPDAFHIRGREVYLHCPNGMGRTKLGNDYFESRLGIRSTVRSWRTVTALLALAERL